MLWVGLTGGIGAGKSAVSSRLVAAGAALVDADRLAREVVAPGTPGLDRVVAAFGPRVLAAGGGLDRAALAAIVFGDDAARRRLNAIVHPLVGERTAALAAAAEADGAALLVHDVPLLVENGLAPLYHLVVVVEAGEQVRLDRLTRLRGMTEADARARLAAQAEDAERRAVADVVLVNDGPLAALHARVDALLAERLRPYADNLAAGRPAPPGPLRLVPPDPQWAAAGERLVARLRAVCGTCAVDVAHIGSTAVPGLAAKDVIDLQVTCADPAGDGRPLDELAPALAAAGFPRVPGVTGDPVRAELNPDPGQYRKRLHRSADPQRPATVHVRPAGSTAARLAVGLRDLLRADPAARQAYAAEKARLLAVESDGERYSEAKTPFLLPLLARVLATPPAGGSKGCSSR